MKTIILPIKVRNTSDHSQYQFELIIAVLNVSTLSLKMQADSQHLLAEKEIFTNNELLIGILKI